jgi:2-aminoadipate transaminase
VPGSAAYADGRGSSSMRLNFSGSNEDEIREGIKRIGKVVWEQVALYETITAEHPLPQREPDTAEMEQAADVLPLHRRRERRE